LVLAGLYLRSSVEMVMRRAIDRVRYITQLWRCMSWYALGEVEV
jgi:hypothetical protein